MTWQAIAIAIYLSAGSAYAVTPAAPQPSLQGLDAAEATGLITKIRDAQTALKTGAPLTFMLLSGSLASNPSTAILPRDAFLNMEFDHPLHIRRVEGANKGWQPYVLAYRPESPGKMVWTVEVITNWNGDIERIEMNYAPPPPF
jgi:hypothetical protein